MANMELSELLEQLASLDKEELAKLTKKANTIKRDRKAARSREALASMFEPLCEAIDKVVRESPNLAAYIATDKDALRVYFNTESEPPTVKADKLAPYKSREYTGGAADGANGNGKGRPIEINMVTATHALKKSFDGYNADDDADDEKAWKRFGSGAEACRALDIPINGANAHLRLDSALPKDCVRSVSV